MRPLQLLLLATMRFNSSHSARGARSERISNVTLQCRRRLRFGLRLRHPLTLQLPMLSVVRPFCLHYASMAGSAAEARVSGHSTQLSQFCLLSSSSYSPGNSPTDWPNLAPHLSGATPATENQPARQHLRSYRQAIRS